MVKFWPVLAVFCGELLGDDVISWPCSFRQWSNTFRDLGALILWMFMIGVEVSKNVYNSCPLKHEVVNLFDVRWNALLWGSEVFPSWEVTCNKIQYNTLFLQHFFHDLAEAELSFINSFSCTYDRQSSVWQTNDMDTSSFDLDDHLIGNDVHWMFYIPEYIAAQMDETRSEVFKLNQSSLIVQVDPCEKCFGVEHGKTSPDYQPMM